MARQVVRGVTLPPGVTLKNSAPSGSGMRGKGTGGGAAQEALLGTLPVFCRFYAHLPSQSGITSMSASGADQKMELRAGGEIGMGGDGHADDGSAETGAETAAFDDDATGSGGGQERFSWAGIAKAKVLAVHPATEPGQRSGWVRQY